MLERFTGRGGVTLAAMAAAAARGSRAPGWCKRLLHCRRQGIIAYTTAYTTGQNQQTLTCGFAAEVQCCLSLGGALQFWCTTASTVYSAGTASSAGTAVGRGPGWGPGCPFQEQAGRAGTAGTVLSAPTCAEELHGVGGQAGGPRLGSPAGLAAPHICRRHVAGARAVTGGAQARVAGEPGEVQNGGGVPAQGGAYQQGDSAQRQGGSR